MKGSTRHDLIVPHDEIFRVKRTWVELSEGKSMPFEARYTAWGAWVVAVILTLVTEYGTGAMRLGWLSALLVLASLLVVTLSVMAVFLFGVDFDKPMLAVLAQRWRGYRLQLSGLLPSQEPKPTTLVLRATARQERPVHIPWYRRLVARVRRRPQPPAPPTPEAETEPSEPAVIRLIPKLRVLPFIGRAVAAEPAIFTVVILGIVLLVFNPWSP